MGRRFLWLHYSNILCTVWGKQTLVSIWPVFVTGRTVFAQAGPSATRLGGELRELCDRRPLLFQNSHCSRTTPSRNVTRTAGNADIESGSRNPAFLLKATIFLICISGFLFTWTMHVREKNVIQSYNLMLLHCLLSCHLRTGNTGLWNIMNFNQ